MVIKIPYFRFIFISSLVFTIYCAHASESINGKVIMDTTGIKIIKVWGSHKERGFAMGYLLAENIRDIYKGYMEPFLGKYHEIIKNHIVVEKVIKIDKIFHDEAESMIQGMKKAGVVIENFDAYNILLSNAFLDLLGLSSLNELRKSRKAHGCSTLMSWGEATKGTELNGKSIVTRHLDWPANDYVIRNQVIVFHNPSEKNEQKWFMIGFAGQISVLSGINKSGLCVFLHMLSDFEEDNIPLPAKPFEPLSFTLRRAIERKDYNKDGKNNIEDIKTALSENKKGYAEGFIVSMLGPTQKTDSLTAAVAELTPTAPYIVYRSNNDSDRINGCNLYAANSSVKRFNKQNFCKRYLAVSQALGSGLNMNSSKCWDIMKNYSKLTNNIQLIQYVPQQKILRISIYKNGRPAYDNKPQVFYLKNIF